MTVSDVRVCKYFASDWLSINLDEGYTIKVYTLVGWLLDLYNNYTYIIARVYESRTQGGDRTGYHYGANSWESNVTSDVVHLRLTSYACT